MIQVNNLEKSYGEQVIFDGAGFFIDPGERVGLVGRNGHGKTTLFNIILEKEHPDSGSVTVPNGYRIGALSQHIRFSANSVLKEACTGLPMNEDAIDESYKAEMILMGLGFSESDFDLDPLKLSGGFQVRLNLAKLLVSDPNLLLLDEPTNYLDILSLRWLRRFLCSWQKELIIITHDRDFMDSVTTHTMAIHRAKIRKMAGPTEKVYRQLLAEEEIHEKTRINDEKKRKEVEQFIDRFRAQATKARAVQSKMKALQKKGQLEKLSDIRNLEFSFNAAPFTGKRLIETKDLSFSFDDMQDFLINGLTLSVSKNDRIAIIGKNGKGKTTLLNLLAGELRPTGGTVSHHQALKSALFGQTNIDRLHPDKTIEEEIMDIHPDQNRGAARKICGAMMFPGDDALKKIRVLSGGEKSRVLLGRLLVSPANLLMLDEPSNHLDMESTESLIEAIDEFIGGVIIVTHSEMILDSIATRLIVFDDGKVTLFEGTYRDFLERVGWKSEPGQELMAMKKKKDINGQPSKKEQRRRRAELINEKSRVLGALNKEIGRIEKEIMALEERTEEDDKELLEAGMKGDAETIAKLSRSAKESRIKIDSLFEKLEILHADLESRTKEFEKRLVSPGQAGG